MCMEPYGFIYKITNKVNGKTYIGQTKNGFNVRYMYNIENTGNKLLKKDIEKYGLDSFEIIKEFDVAYTVEELDELEKTYIQQFHSLETEHGYNRMTGGKNGKPTEQLREELSESHKGYVMPELQKTKISEALSGEKSHMYGVPKSEKVKQKISHSLKEYYKSHDAPAKGRKLSQEEIERLRTLRKGVKQPADAVKRTADALRGVPKSEEHRKHISESRKGIQFSEEHRKHIGEAKKGTHLSEEHKRKFAYSRLGKTNSDYQKQRVAEINGKRVRRIDTGDIYVSISEAAKMNGMSDGTVRNNCRGITKTAKGIRFEFV